MSNGDEEDGAFHPPTRRASVTLAERVTRLEERQAQNRLDIARVYKIFAWLGGVVGASIILSIMSQVIKTAGPATGLLP